MPSPCPHVAAGVDKVRLSLEDQRRLYPTYQAWEGALTRREAYRSFPCQLCDARVIDIKSHCREDHKVSERGLDTLAQIWESAERKSVMIIECESCRRDVQFNFETFENHLRNNHQEKTIQSYFKEFVLNKTTTNATSALEEIQPTIKQEEEDTPDPPDEEVNNEHEADPEGDVDISDALALIEELSKAEASVVASESVESKILSYKKLRKFYTFSSAECPSCNFEAHSLEEAMGHLRELANADHDMEVPDHRCLVCGEHVAEVPSAVDAHLRSAHGGLNLLQYFKLFEQPETWAAGSLLRCQECGESDTGFESTDEAKFEAHLRRKHPRVTSADYVARHGSTVFAKSMIECVFCGRMVRHTVKYLKAHGEKKCSKWAGLDAFFKKWKARVMGDMADHKTAVSTEKGVGSNVPAAKTFVPELQHKLAEKRLNSSVPSPETPAARTSVPEQQRNSAKKRFKSNVPSEHKSAEKRLASNVPGHVENPNMEVAGTANYELSSEALISTVIKLERAFDETRPVEEPDGLANPSSTHATRISETTSSTMEIAVSNVDNRDSHTFDNSDEEIMNSIDQLASISRETPSLIQSVEEAVNPAMIANSPINEESDITSDEADGSGSNLSDPTSEELKAMLEESDDDKENRVGEKPAPENNCPNTSNNSDRAFQDIIEQMKEIHGDD